MEEEEPRGFLEELRSLDEKAKKRVLVAGTILIMVVVVTVWLAYFNSIVGGASQAANEEASSTANAALVPTTTPAPANGPSMWQNIENGLGFMKNIFSSSSDYAIQPKSN